LNELGFYERERVELILFDDLILDTILLSKIQTADYTTSRILIAELLTCKDTSCRENIKSYPELYVVFSLAKNLMYP
ncbi:27658_t:CDS:2, partial [Gigaspora margarita]